MSEWRISHESPKILIVEDDQGLGELLCEELHDTGLTARLASTAEYALTMMSTWMPDVVVSDLRLPGADGLALLQSIRNEYPENPPDVLIITAFGSVAKAVESLKSGAEDFLTKPLDLEHFRLTLNRMLEKRRLRVTVRQMERLMSQGDSFHGIYGQSRVMLTLFQHIQRIAKAEGPVLISGESGTGKELVARAMHAESNSAQGPFLAVNCAGIPENLLESEFFGHAAGAFTGATRERQGLFAEAEGGTLLLDEISEMPLTLQAKLLRMLQDGSIRPVGGNRERQVNVRVLAATHRDLEQRVHEGTFREDLFFRLETFSLLIPPLRERDDDIDLLAGVFLAKQAFTAQKNVRGFSARSQELLRDYFFPGNVRELRNAIERAVVYCQDREIRPEHLPPRIRKRSRPLASDGDLMQRSELTINDDSLPTLETIERRYIRQVMEHVNGNKRQAAEILGIARRTLYRRLEELAS